MCMVGTEGQCADAWADARSAQRFAGRLQRAGDVFGAVRRADEAGFVHRRREVDAAVQHGVEEAVEAFLVGSS